MIAKKLQKQEKKQNENKQLWNSEWKQNIM